MKETPEEYSQRVLKMALEAKQPLDLHDSNLNRLEKAKTETVEKKEPELDWYEKMVKEKCVERGVFYEAPEFKVTPKPKTVHEKIDQLYDEYKAKGH